jgi:hypothetical protein
VVYPTSLSASRHGLLGLGRRCSIRCSGSVEPADCIGEWIGDLAPRSDRVSFSVGVDTEAANVAEAFQRNTEKVNRVVVALKKKGVTPQQIQTSNFTITSRDEQGKKIGGYRVTNIVMVTRDSVAALGEILQAAVSAGANEAGSLQFAVANEKSVQLRGLELAFEDARIKAAKLATLAGKSLGDVLSVSDQGTYQPSSYVAEAITVTAAPALEAGMQDLSFRVSVVFELR